MPRLPSSNKSKAQRAVAQYGNEFVISPTGELYCILCNCLVKHDKAFHVQQHRQTAKHSRRLQQPSASTQQFLPSIDFGDKVVRAFLSADIPLYKLRHQGIQRLFSSIGHPLPSESACRNKVDAMAAGEINRMVDMLHNSPFFIVIDESNVRGTNYLHILVGKLEEPAKTYLFDCLPLVSTPDAGTIVRSLDDVIQKLDARREHFLLLLSDAASYMKSAGRTLKILYTNLFHVTCTAHLIHNCAMRVREHFDDVDNLIARVKAATVKNKKHRALFNCIGEPPSPILTRWASWIEAALYYAAKLPEVRQIVSQLSGDSLLVRRAKEAVDNVELPAHLLAISQNYKRLAELPKQLESATCTIKEAAAIINSMDLGADPCGIRAYVESRLEDNDLHAIMNMSRWQISPDFYGLLQSCQPTSASVERSFSMLKKLLQKDRNFLSKNVKNYMILYFNASV